MLHQVEVWNTLVVERSHLAVDDHLRVGVQRRSRNVSERGGSPLTDDIVGDYYRRTALQEAKRLCDHCDVSGSTLSKGCPRPIQPFSGRLRPSTPQTGSTVPFRWDRDSLLSGSNPRTLRICNWVSPNPSSRRSRRGERFPDTNSQTRTWNGGAGPFCQREICEGTYLSHNHSNAKPSRGSCGLL